jgi:hypothetical protein
LSLAVAISDDASLGEIEEAGVEVSDIANVCFATKVFEESLQDKLSAWSEAAEDERLIVARALTVVASQGLPSLNEEFFESCIDFASAQPELQPKKIGEIGSMCVVMHLRFSDRKLRP